MGPALPPALTVNGIAAGYGGVSVLSGVELRVPRGSVVALLGPNGAGKTTLLRVISGLLSPRAGTICLNDRDVTKLPPYKRARLGLCHIPEGRGIFRALTVRENLELSVPPWESDGDISVALDAFPALGARIRSVAGSLSGGEQQMLALSRAYLARPDILLVDELSMGLAPVAIDSIFASVRQIVATGVSLIMVEQYIHRAIEIADAIYLMSQGQVKWSGDQSEITDQTISEVYFGSEVG
jgi:branched-chain amino acid transport system ATP-binding protein